jgi:hypothetical protein
MSLSTYKPKTITVEFPDGDFEVRGLSLPDVAVLVDSHEYVINNIVTKVRTRKEIIEAEGGANDEALANLMGDLFMEIIRESPMLAANIIAICADEPDQMVNASRLPIVTQVEALTAIGDLTFKDMASVKKFVANVTKLIRGILPSETATLAAA